jgi:DNA polymerase-1
MIVAPDKHWMVCSDYGQIEARIIGVASQDEEFCNALWEDDDVHMHWAKVIAEEYPKVIGGSHNLDDKAAMKKFRAAVKNLWVFPAFYGASPHSISKGIGVPIEIVMDIFREFWRTFRGVKRWQKWILDRYEKLGYVETLSGRRRHAPMSMNAVLNASIQGFASDICVDAMCRLDRTGIQTVMQIHDDISCYVKDSELEETVELIAQEMCLVPYPFINVPIAVEISVGPNWFDQEGLGSFKSTDFHDVPNKLQDFTKLYDKT